MSLPIDRTNKSALDTNLNNGITSDAPKVKANNDTLYNTIDELFNRMTQYLQGYSRFIDGGAFTDTGVGTTYDGGTF